ncbi:MAG: ParB/RepB/Spo0J family partition protein [Selenomonadaceae bacterium]|nr:ParB/RepB/Spo0J family partition protein [Selenomonadaceae bacterium]
MAVKGQGGLGKGLGALLKDRNVGAPTGESVLSVQVEDISPNPYQPRQEFAETALEELKNSVLSYGILQPLLVRKLSQGRYELIAGERRLRAAKLAGLTTVPVIVKEYSDRELSELAIIENIQREDLNVMEEARAYKRLMEEFSLSQETVAQKIGRSRSHIANILRFLNLAPRAQEMVEQGTLTMGQARPLITLEDKTLQETAAAYIQAQSLTARECEALAKRLQKEPTYLQKKLEPQAPAPEPKVAAPEPFMREAQERLQERLGTQVKILPGKKRSRIQIDFYSEEDLERLLENLLAERTLSPKSMPPKTQRLTV